MYAARNLIRSLAILLVFAALLAGGYALYGRLRPERQATSDAGLPPRTGIAQNTVELTRQTVDLARITTTPAAGSTRPRTLELRGSLAIDPNRLVHVHARFPGQIVELAKIPTKNLPNREHDPFRRQLGFMDHVEQDQHLAVLWSKDLGEKKSELVDVLARLRLDRQALERLQDLSKRGGTTEKAVRDAERQVEVGEIAASRAERTLRSWMLSEHEIEQVKAEADRIHKHDPPGAEQDTNWARLDITAPIDGTIVEKNVTIGDIVDTATDLFKVADLSVLRLWLHAFEEDLPYLQALPRPIRARIRLPANPEVGELAGGIERIGEIIDPNEHMALLIGTVDNLNGELRAGQFITATVEILPETGVVEIPTTALVDDGDQSYVFVQADPDALRYSRRRVLVGRRYHDVVYLHGKLTAAQREQGYETVQPGEQVVSSGALQLEETLRSQPAKPAEKS